MEAHISGTGIRDTRLDLKYNILPGCTTLKTHSIYLIRKLWPENLVSYVETLLEKVEETRKVIKLFSS